MPVTAPISLNARQMDAITVGNATATSDGTAQALGAATTASSVSNDLSVAGGSPIAGAPLIDYAMSQTDALARGTFGVHVDATSRTGVTDGKRNTVTAALAGTATGTPPTARANTTLQVFAVATANGTRVLFGSITATACCVPAATTQTSAAIGVDGPYTRIRKVQPLNIHPETSSSAIDFAAVSSSLPLLDPFRLQAATAGPRF